MAYVKQNFKNGSILTAEQLNHMEDGIVEALKSGGAAPDTNPGGGSASLPEAAPYQQLVTDGSGNTVWEDRLAYDAGKQYVELVSEHSITDEEQWEGMDCYNSYINFGESEPKIKFIPSNRYRVVFNGNEYILTATQERIFGSDEAWDIQFLGNKHLYREEFEDTGEPFVASVGPYGNSVEVNWSLDLGDTVTIQIFEEHYVVKRFDAKFSPFEPFVVKVSSTWNEEIQEDVYNADQSFEKIIEVYKEGRPVQVLLGDDLDSRGHTMLNLSYIDVDRSLFGGNSSEGNSKLVSIQRGEHVSISERWHLPQTWEGETGYFLQSDGYGYWQAVEAPYLVDSTGKKWKLTVGTDGTLSTEEFNG